MTPVQAREYISFRQLDEAAGCPKGTAFRAFKYLDEKLREDRDFILLRADSAPELIEQLRAEDRIYAGSVNVVLLQPSAAERLRNAMPGFS